ncbi:MAG: hypothetical protein HRU41_27185 [Saprospiraceae bacterium]|nr:hypothetical protein [Saprospiraceae bacterium]
MIPDTFESWKSCIVNDCKIKLTSDFVKRRLQVYNNKRNPETRKFVALYGEQHLENIIYWLERSAKEMGQR